MCDGRFDVAPCDECAALLRSPIARLADEIADETEPKRQPVASVGEPVPIPDNFRHRVGTEVRQILFAAKPGNELGILFLVPLVAIDLHVEIGLYLKHLRKVFFVGLQQMQQQRGTHEHHLDDDRDRLGSQSRRRKAVELARIFDGRFPGPHDPFQGVPRKRLAQEIDRIHQQESAVRQQHGTGSNLREIGVHDAEVGPPLDFSDQVGVSRVGLVDDRRAAARLMLDEEIDLEPAQICALQLDARNGDHRTFPRKEVFIVMNDVLLDTLEVDEDARKILIRAAQRFIPPLHYVRNERAIKVAKLMLGFLFERMDAHVKLPDLAFQRLAPVGQRLLLLLRHRLHVLFRHGTTGLEGDEAESHRSFFEAEPA